MSPDTDKPMAQAVKILPIQLLDYDILAFKRFDWKNNTGYVIDLRNFDGDIQTFH
jgi:hypothetical protein